MTSWCQIRKGEIRDGDIACLVKKWKLDSSLKREVAIAVGDDFALSKTIGLLNPHLFRVERYIIEEADTIPFWKWIWFRNGQKTTHYSGNTTYTTTRLDCQFYFFRIWNVAPYYSSFAGTWPFATLRIKKIQANAYIVLYGELSDSKDDGGAVVSYASSIILSEAQLFQFRHCAL